MENIRRVKDLTEVVDDVWSANHGNYDRIKKERDEFNKKMFNVDARDNDKRSYSNNRSYNNINDLNNRISNMNNFNNRIKVNELRGRIGK